MNYFPCPICSQTDGFHTIGCNDIKARIVKLETELAEARKDSARLEEIFKFGCVEIVAKRDEWRMSVSQYLFSQSDWHVTALYFGKTPRSVIDQAIADKKKGGQNDEK